MLILSRRDVLDLLTLHDCIGAVERAFRLRAEGRTLGPGVLGVPAADGGFHVKAAGLVGERSYFAAKTNANFPENPQRFGLPTTQGTIVLADASTGRPGVAARLSSTVSVTFAESSWRQGVSSGWLTCGLRHETGRRLRPIRRSSQRHRRGRGTVSTQFDGECDIRRQHCDKVAHSWPDRFGVAAGHVDQRNRTT